MSEDSEDSRKEVDAAGIRSDVTRKAHPFNETVGHVLFLDCEDTEFQELKAWCNDNLDFYFIFRSSKRNYHVISPVIRSAVEIHRIKKSCPHDDDTHNRIGYDKRGWVLRVTEKGDKPAPDLIAFNNTVIPENYSGLISEPHVNYVIDEFDTYRAVDLLKDVPEVAGYALKIVQYGTYEKHLDEDGEE